MELHELELTDGQWWACEQPERPPENDKITYDMACRFCSLKAEVDVQNGHLNAKNIEGTEYVSLATAIAIWRDPDSDDLMFHRP